MEHEKLIKKVIEMIKEEEKDINLSNQFDNAEMTLKETECGFFVYFTKMPNQYRKETNKTIDYVYGKSDDEAPIVGFVVYMENGLIKMLEAYTFGNIEWPENEDKVNLFIQN